MKRSPGRPAVDPMERFWSKVNKTESCWLWTDAPTADGYGRFWDGNTKVLAHRYSWSITSPSHLGGAEIDHACLERLCVNPSHLRIVTRKQNNENKSGAYRNNLTGVRGVTRTRNGKPYKAIVGHNGESFYLGRFDSIDEAEQAAIRKRIELFTHNEIDKSTYHAEGR